MKILPLASASCMYTLYICIPRFLTIEVHSFCKNEMQLSVRFLNPNLLLNTFSLTVSFLQF